MSTTVKQYFSGIEEKIIEELNSANERIYIAMAWLTNRNIMYTLQNILENKKLDIKIIVDNNLTNQKYYFGRTEFQKLFSITKKYSSNFLHSKFIIIDKDKVLTGSYNLSQKANNNIENIVIISSKRLNDNYYRQFNFLFEENYVDKNIKLLIKHKEFARVLLSTYYNFTKREYYKYKDKIELGDCYSYFNGYCDMPGYYPGLIFNKSIKHRKINTKDFLSKDYISSEITDLPIKKERLQEWVKSYRLNNIIESFRGHKHLYHLINDELDEAETSIESQFKRKIENCYSYTKIERLIKDNVDIIIENELWKTNFEPFMNKKIVSDIFNHIAENKNYG